MTADAAFWNNLAHDYARKPVENPDAFERKIAATTSLMTRSDTVLDIGCGTGSLALRLARHGGHVHGLDLSDVMIGIADDKARAGGVDNVSFHVGPFDSTFDALEPGSLDGVCAYSILHLVQERPAALAQIFDLLKPGGFFVSSTVCLGETWVPYTPLLAVMRWFGKAPRVESFSKATLADEIQRAGFVDLRQPDVGAKATIGFMRAHKGQRDMTRTTKAV
jgi:arsenite methyltransferase